MWDAGRKEGTRSINPSFNSAGRKESTGSGTDIGDNKENKGGSQHVDSTEV